MMPTRKHLFLALALAATAFGLNLCAEVKLPAVFADYMVLQRDQPIPVWGWAEPAEKITVSLSTTPAAVTAVTTADQNGSWLVKLPPQPAGGPFTLAIAGSNRIECKDVLIGEVWLCSGQSNMAWVVKNSLNPEEEKKLAAANSHIRQFKVKNVTSGYPEKDLPGDWAVCTSDTVEWFTATGYFFARELSRHLPGVPIGLLNSSWGGTRIEPWTPPEGFATVPSLKNIHDTLLRADPRQDEYKANLTKYLGELDQWRVQAGSALAAEAPLAPAPAYPPSLIPLSERQSPAALYNAMIHPLIPYTIRGALWYQGEANLREGMLYADKKLALVNGWRQLWQQDFPFYFVQLAPYRYGDGKQDSTVMGDFWEAQSACEKIPGVYMAVINDIGDVNDIHPKNKQEVGRRLCLLALAHTYGKTGIEFSGPKFKAMTIDGNTLRITFDHARGLTTRDGKAPDNFEIIGEGTDFLPAVASIDGETIVLSHPDIGKPAAMRFAWHKLSEPNLTNAAGLPAAAFRAGEVPVIDYFQLRVPEAKDMTLVYDLNIGSHGSDIVYDVNNAANIKTFSRVAYFLELQPRGEPVQYVYVAMDAFTDDPTKIGVPTFESKAVFQTKVSNLTVLSNVKGIVNGNLLQDAGCIEFWSHNYSPDNAKAIPGASSQLYDFGDAISQGKPDGYGSMQVHNYAAQQTIFAYNTWKSGQSADLGIGNSPAGTGSAANTRDWTFNKNASNYTIKRLRVFVR